MFKHKRELNSNTLDVAQKSYLFDPRIVIPVLCCAVLLAFTWGWGNSFVYWDDPVYVTDNPFIQSPDFAGLLHLLKTECLANYHPLTMASLWLNAFVFGKGATSFIITNTVIHVLNTILIFFFARQLSAKNSRVPFFTALLWGLHPMHTESVIWVSERKDVLYVFFFLLSCIQYTFFLETEKRKHWIYAIVFFLLSCLAKGMAVVLPLILVLLDYWFGKKWYSSKCLVQKAPFFTIALIFGIIAIDVQAGGNLGGLLEKLSQNGDSAINTNLGIVQKICFGSYALWVYIFKLFFPVHQHNFYTYPAPGQYYDIQYIIAPIGVLALLVFVAVMYKRRKVFFFGTLFFLLTIVPVLQFVQLGSAIVSERYTYLSYFGLIFMLVYWADEYADRKLLMSALGLVAAAFIFLTYRQTQTYKDTITLFLNSYKYEPNAERVNEVLVANYCMNGDYASAMDYGQKAIEAGTASWKTLLFIGKASYYQKSYQRSSAIYKKAIAMAPANKISSVYFEEGITDRALGDYRQSEADFDNAINADSIRKPAITSSMFYERGLTKKLSGNYAMAASDFGLAIQYDSSSLGRIIKEKAFAELQAQDWQAAEKDYTSMLERGISPDLAYNNRGGAKFKTGDTAGAVMDFKAALKINPDFRDAKNNLLKAGVMPSPQRQ